MVRGKGSRCVKKLLEVILGGGTGSKLRWAKGMMGTRVRLRDTWTPARGGDHVQLPRSGQHVGPASAPKDQAGREGSGVRKDF